MNWRGHQLAGANDCAVGGGGREISVQQAAAGFSMWEGREPRGDSCPAGNISLENNATDTCQVATRLERRDKLK